MIKRTLKRTLSVFLTLVLLATTFFIFDPSVLKLGANAWVNVEDNTMGSSLPTQKANAPETIYIKPGYSTFDCYSLLNVDAGTAGDSTSTTGSVSFSNGGSTDATLYVNDVLKKTGNGTYSNSGVTITASTQKLHLGAQNTTQFNGYVTKASIASTAGGTTQATKASDATPIAGGEGASSFTYTFSNTQCWFSCDEGEVYIIEWVVEYKIGSNYHYEFMYSGIYKCSTGLVGVSAFGRNTGGGMDTPKVAGFAFITGAMGYAKTGNSNCRYTVTGVTSTTSSPTWAAPLVQFAGQCNNSSTYSIPNTTEITEDDGSDTNGYYSHFTSATAGTGNVMRNKTSHNARNCNFVTQYTNYGTYLSPGTTYSSTLDCTAGDGSSIGVAYMVVDTSRYSNYSQIPYLSCGFVRYFETVGDAGQEESKLSSIVGKSADLSTDVSVSAVGIDSGDHFDDDDSDHSPTYSRTYGLYKLSGGLQGDGANGFTLYFTYIQGVWGWAGTARNSCYFHLGVGLSTTQVNKDAIRKAYCALMTSNLDKVTYSSGYADYYSKMKTQACYLCDPTCTLNTCSLTESTIDAQQKTLVAANTSDVVTFYVPETIYLVPQNGNMNSFQYYVDRENSKDGALNTSATKTSGNIYAYVPSATSVSLSVSGASCTIGTTTGTTTINTTITAGTLDTALTQNNSTTIEWTLSFTINGESYSVKNYSTVYAPLVDVPSGTADGRYSSSWSNRVVQHCITTWVSGLHVINASRSNISGNSDSTGLYKHKPLVSGNSIPNSNNSSDVYGSGTGGSFFYKSDDNATGDGGYGSIYVDYSRYSNLNQIPNLKVGLDMNYYKGNGTSGKYSRLGYYRYGSSEATENGGVKDTGSDGVSDGSNIFTSTVSDSVVTTANQLYIVRGFNEMKGSGNGSTRNSLAYAAFYTLPVTKGTLRTALNNELASAKQEDWYINTTTNPTWTNYANALKEAANILGKPNATQTEVTTAENNIETYKNALRKNTGSVSANHIGLNSTAKTLGTDTAETYDYGDTTHGGYNDYVGYIPNLFYAADLKANTYSSRSASNIASVSADESTNSLTVTSGSGTVNYTNHPGPGGDGSNYYYIPVTPGSTITLSYTVSGTSSQVFFFGMDENKKVTGTDWVDGTNLKSNYTNSATTAKQTLSWTVPSDIHYVTFRFGNQTANSTTTFSNITFTNGETPATEAATTRTTKNVTTSTVTYRMTYIPKKYDISYDPNGGTFNGSTDITTYTEIAEYNEAFTVGSVALGGSAVAAPTKTGYNFENWEYNSQTYTNGQSITWNYDVTSATFIANWQAKSYNVVYNINDNTTHPATALKDLTVGSFYYDENITAPSQNDSNNIVKRTGYTLQGWATKASPATTDYIEFGGSYSVYSLVEAYKATHSNQEPAEGATLEVYARWAINSYYLDLNGVLDGTSGGNISGYGTADVTVEGTLKGNDVADFYQQFNYGSSYTINDIKATEGHYYDGVYSGSLTGTIPASNVGVYLKFNTEQYTLKFRQNYSSSDTTELSNVLSNATVKYGTSQSFTNPTRTGYNFGGWYKEQACTNQAYSNASTQTIIDHGTNGTTYTLYAKWSPKDITVNYNAGGGSGTIAAGSFKYNATYTVKSNTFTAPSSRTITLDPNEGSWTNGDTGNKTVSSSATATGKWTCNKVDSSTTFTSGTAYNSSQLGVGDSDSITLTAQWSWSAVTMPTITRTGYNFAGWKTSSDVTRVSANGGSYTPTVAETLHADWTINSYDVQLETYGNNTYSNLDYYVENVGGTVKVNSGTAGATASDTITYNTSYSITAAAATGYKFVGWFTSSPVDGALQGSAASTSTTWNRTMGGAASGAAYTETYYAVFQYNVCTVKAYAYSNSSSATGTYANNATGGTVTASASTTGTAGATSECRVAESGTASLTAEADTGYWFEGWYSAAPTSNTTWGTRASASATLSVAYTSDGDTISRYARFEINQNTLKVNPNSGSVKVGTTTYTATQSFKRVGGTSITVYKPTRTGYIFQGWDRGTLNGTFPTKAETKSAASATYVYSNSTHETTDTITAAWTAITYTIKFNKNDANATGTMSDQTITYDVATNLTANSFSKTGYDFQGWATATGTTTVTYTDGQSVKNLKSSQGDEVNLYAVWAKHNYNVKAYAYYNTAATPGTWTADATGGNVKIGSGTAGASASTTVAYDTSFTITATPATGYSCAGLYSAAPTNSGKTWGTAISGTTTNSSTGVLTYTKNVGAADENYYAKFNIKSYTVSVVAKYNTAAAPETWSEGTTGGTVSISASSAYYNTTVTLSSTAATGYKLQGWYTSSDFSTSTTSTPTVTANTTYYGRFDIQQYTVNVYAYVNSAAAYTTYTNAKTGGTVSIEGISPAVAIKSYSSSATSTIYYGATYKVYAKVASGYTFDGWYTDSTFATAKTGATETNTTTSPYYSVFTKTNATENVYAKFTIRSYDLVVYAQYNSGSSTASYAYGDFGGTVQIGSGTAGATATAQLYYKSNITTGGVTGVTVTAEEKTGYTFEGWYKAVTGGKGKAVTAWTTLLVSDDTTSKTLTVPASLMTGAKRLYAKFTAKSFTINLDANLATEYLKAPATTTSVTAYYNGSVTLDATTKPTKYGASLLGWSKLNNATTADYEYSSDGNCVLTAAQVNLLFPSEGTSTSIYAVYDDYDYNEAFLAAYNTGAKPNEYKVGTTGGTLAKKSGVTELRPGNTTTITSQVVCTANTGYHFSEIRYGATSAPTTGSVIQRSFGSYGTNDSEYMQNIEGNCTIVFVAFYDVNSYTLKLYAESQSAAGTYGNNTAGGTVKITSTGVAGATATASVYYGVSTALIAETKSGYTFVGWYSAAPTNNKTWGTAVSTNTTYNASLTGDNGITISYYARFDIKSYKAYAYAEYYTDGKDTATGIGTAGVTGGTVTVSATGTGAYSAASATTTGASAVSINAKYNQEVTYTATEVTGYSFEGWYYSSGESYDTSAGEGDIQSDSAFSDELTYNDLMPDSDIRIHAKFVPKNFILVFDVNAGSAAAVLGPTAAVTLTYNKAATLDSTSIPTCSGKSFLGWSETSTASTATYKYTDNVCTISTTVINRWYGELVDNSKTVYAIWQAATYIITLDFDGGNDNASAQASISGIALGDALPDIAELPLYEGYKFDGYYSEPGGQGKQYYDENGGHTANWDVADNATLYAKWICPVLTNATYDDSTKKWTYTYETTSGATITSSGSTSTFDQQDITDKGLALSNVKEITSRDKTEKDFIINKNDESKDINLNHYTHGSLSQILSCVSSTNTEKLRSSLSQPQLNAYVAKLAYYLSLALTANHKTESNKTSLKIYETKAKLNSVKQDTITDSEESATGATYTYPSSSDAGSYVYTDKWSDVQNGAVDYYIYTNSTSPVIAIEIDDGEVLTTSEIGGSKAESSYPTKATVTARDSNGTASGDLYETGAVPATDNISEAWFAPYVAQNIGVGSEETKKEHDYNAKTVLYLTPSFSSNNASGTTNEVVYTITPSDDAYVNADGSGNVINNSGLTGSEIADASSTLRSKFTSLNSDDTDQDSITVCISYHNAMNGTSDEGGSDTCLQMNATQLDGEGYSDKWVDQMHLIRTSGGADNWELPLTTEGTYPVDDATFRNTNGYVLGSFAYVFDANTEPAAAERAFNEDYSAAKDLIIDSIKGNMANAYSNISNNSFYSYDSKDSNSGLGMFAIKGWSSNYYPRPDSYVFVHLVDRWGNVFNRVWRNLQVDSVKPKITGTTTMFNLAEAGGSNLESFTLTDVDVDFVTDVDSTFENNVFTSSGNTFVLSTDKPSTKIPLVVKDNAGNQLSGKIPTDSNGLLKVTVTDEFADLSDGAYTFMINDTEVNLWAREPALIRDVDVSASSISGEPCTFIIKTMDSVTKVQLIESGSTRTYTPDMSNVTIVDNGDGTLTWTIKANPLSLGEHTFQIKCKDNTGKWNDSDLTITTTVSTKPTIKADVIQSINDTSCGVDERAVLEISTIEGTQAIRVMYDDGYSTTISRSDDIVTSCVDGVEVWRVTAGSFKATGEYTASAYAKYNGVWYKSDVATCTITVTNTVKIPAAILSVMILDEEINADEQAKFEIITNKATEKLQFVLPNDTSWTVTKDNAEVTDNGDGTLKWTVSKSFGAGSINEITLKAKSKAGWTEASNYGTVTVK